MAHILYKLDSILFAYKGDGGTFIVSPYDSLIDHFKETTRLSTDNGESITIKQLKKLINDVNRKRSKGRPNKRG